MVTWDNGIHDLFFSNFVSLMFTYTSLGIRFAGDELPCRGSPCCLLTLVVGIRFVGDELPCRGFPLSFTYTSWGDNRMHDLFFSIFVSLMFTYTSLGIRFAGDEIPCRGSPCCLLTLVWGICFAGDELLCRRFPLSFTYTSWGIRFAWDELPCRGFLSYIGRLFGVFILKGTSFLAMGLSSFLGIKGSSTKCTGNQEVERAWILTLL